MYAPPPRRHMCLPSAFIHDDRSDIKSRIQYNMSKRLFSNFLTIIPRSRETVKAQDLYYYCFQLYLVSTLCLTDVQYPIVFRIQY